LSCPQTRSPSHSKSVLQSPSGSPSLNPQGCSSVQQCQAIQEVPLLQDICGVQQSITPVGSLSPQLLYPQRRAPLQSSSTSQSPSPSEQGSPGLQQSQSGLVFQGSPRTQDFSLQQSASPVGSPSQLSTPQCSPAAHWSCSSQSPCPNEQGVSGRQHSSL
jgi:hypothetical protein